MKLNTLLIPTLIGVIAPAFCAVRIDLVDNAIRRTAFGHAAGRDSGPGDRLAWCAGAGAAWAQIADQHACGVGGLGGVRCGDQQSLVELP